MPNTMKIQPVDFTSDQVVRKPVFRSRVRRLFDRHRRTPSAQQFKQALTSVPNKHGSGSDQEFDPSTLCLAKMVQNYIEESNTTEKQRCGRNKCNCFNGTASASSDEDEWEFYYDSPSSSLESACEALKILAPCADVSERNILADVSKIVEKNKRKDNACKEGVINGLVANGYNASTCKSKWEKSPAFPAGEYEYVEVITEGGSERLIVDIDFRSQFEIARPTKAYKTILQALPGMFVGTSDRLEKIVDVASEAAKQSLNKKGMPIPPWRKAEYVKAKWLSPQMKLSSNNTKEIAVVSMGKPNGSILMKTTSPNGDVEIINNHRSCDGEELDIPPFVAADGEGNGTNQKRPYMPTMVKKWEPPEVIARPTTSMHKGVKPVTGGLTSLIEDNRNP